MKLEKIFSKAADDAFQLGFGLYAGSNIVFLTSTAAQAVANISGLQPPDLVSGNLTGAVCGVGAGALITVGGSLFRQHISRNLC